RLGPVARRGSRRSCRRAPARQLVAIGGQPNASLHERVVTLGQLAADVDERSRRRAAARAARPAARDWAEAARDFLAAQRAPGSE
ncbi:MAG: hypothetical protein ACXVCV_10925, partial [Polyangia bacterium]